MLPVKSFLRKEVWLLGIWVEMAAISREYSQLREMIQLFVGYYFQYSNLKIILYYNYTLYNETIVDLLLGIVFFFQVIRFILAINWLAMNEKIHNWNWKKKLILIFVNWNQNMSKIPKSRYIKRNKFNIQRRNLSGIKVMRSAKKRAFMLFSAIYFFLSVVLENVHMQKNRPLTWISLNFGD